MENNGAEVGDRRSMGASSVSYRNIFSTFFFVCKKRMGGACLGRFYVLF